MCFFIYGHIILLAVRADFVSLIGCLLIFFELDIAPIYTSSLCKQFSESVKYADSENCLKSKSILYYTYKLKYQAIKA